MHCLFLSTTFLAVVSGYYTWEPLMFIMYVDESGDSGLVKSPTPFFALTGIVVHELRWRNYLDELISFRNYLKQRYGLKLREEFHSAKFISKPGELHRRIKRSDRLAMIREYSAKLASLSDISIINVLVDKSEKNPEYDVFSFAWRALIQRFENTIRHRNFRGPNAPDERGIIICDHTEDKKLKNLLRQMRRYNPIPNQVQFGSGYRDLPLNYLIEDPVYRDSEHSYFIQSADLAAFLLYQYHSPNAYFRRKGGKNYFLRLSPVICRQASPSNPLGVVKL